MNPILEKQLAILKSENIDISSCDQKFLNLISGTYDALAKQNDILHAEYDDLLLQYEDIKDSLVAEELFKLRSLEAKYEKFYEHAVDAFLCIDGHKFLFCNQAALDIFGAVSKDALSAFSLLDLSPEFQLNGISSKKLLADYINKAFASELNSFEWLFTKLNGDTFLAELNVAILEIDGSQVLHATLRNLSANKSLHNAVSLIDSLGEENNHKTNEFLVNISRDMKVALSSTIGFSEIVKNTRLDLVQLNALTNLISSLKILSDLINEIYLLFGLKTSKIIMDYRLSNMQQMLDTVAADCNNFFTKPSVFFEYVSNLHVAFYEFDKNYLKHVITALIHNASKFTVKGAVRFKVVIVEDKKDYSVLKFEVIDTGIGIPEEHKLKIFEPFYCVENRFIENVNGHGIGLFIAKMLVDLMGSELKVESEIGRGARFWFELKLQKTEEVLGGVESVKHEKNFDFSGKKILVVEDNKINQLLTKSFLDKVHAQYEMVDNGKLALEKIQEQDFDLVLMDIHMPIMNGVEATKHIRALDDKNKSTVTIIALTANVAEKEINYYKAVGMNDFLFKPVESRNFFKVLNTWLTPKIDSI